jgi:PIN domain nuclease of toxin-antitoxin system
VGAVRTPAPARLVLDAGPVIALLLEEASADQVDALLRRHASRLNVVNAAEVVDVLIRRHGGAPDEVAPKLDQLVASGVELVSASLELATRAGELRARLFDRRSRRVSLADCFVLATANGEDSVVTTDSTLAAAAAHEGFDVVELG